MQGEVRTGQIGRTAQQLGQQRAVGIQAILRGLAAGNAGPFGLTLPNVGVSSLSKTLGQFPRQATQEFETRRGSDFV